MNKHYGPRANNPLIQNIDQDALRAYRRGTTDAVTGIDGVKEQVAEICAKTLALHTLTKDTVLEPEHFTEVIYLLGDVYGMLETLHADREVDDIDRLATLANIAPQVQTV